MPATPVHNTSQPKPPPRILLVDDEPGIRDVLASLLRHHHYGVEIAVDGWEAWQALSADLGRIDLVITDNQMPRLDGFTLIQMLRKANFGGKIIVFSSSLTLDKSEKLRVLGVDAIIEKGTKPAELLEAVRRATSSPAGAGAQKREE
jgi:two-component system, OmpR family, response regulator ArlR